MEALFAMFLLKLFAQKLWAYIIAGMCNIFLLHAMSIWWIDAWILMREKKEFKHMYVQTRVSSWSWTMLMHVGANIFLVGVLKDIISW